MKRLVGILLCYVLLLTCVRAQLSVDSLETCLAKSSGGERAKLLNELAEAYLDNHPSKSIVYAEEALFLAEEINDTVQMASAYSLLGEGYFYQENYDKALDHFQSLVAIRKAQGDAKYIAEALNNLGIAYSYQDKHEAALTHYREALRMHKTIDNLSGVSNTLNNIGVLYEKRLEDYPQALAYYRESLDIERELNNHQGIAVSLFNIGDVFRKMEKQDMALIYYRQSQQLADSLKLMLVMEDIYQRYYLIYKTMQDSGKALAYYEQYIALRDKHHAQEHQNKLTEIEARFQSERQQREIERLNHDRYNQQQTVRRQRWLIYFMAFVFFILFVSSMLLYRQFILKKKTNKELIARHRQILQQKEEIQVQRDELRFKQEEIERQSVLATRQRDEIARQSKEITASIEYASKLQMAILPPVNTLEEVFEESFVLYRPRDIVSGDFYWMRQIGHKFVLAVADCTGHGVPGAFMSMLGSSFLMEIVNKHIEQLHHSGSEQVFSLNAGQILNELREQVKEALHQHGKSMVINKDGMDIALCVIDTKKNMLDYAGAFCPMYIIRKDAQFQVYKSDRMPIGVYPREVPFSDTFVELEKGDVVYLFSDGIIDQIGQSDQKFKPRRFKQLLKDVHEYPLYKQCELINQTIDHWRGRYEQIDDILIVGFKA